MNEQNRELNGDRPGEGPNPWTWPVEGPPGVTPAQGKSVAGRQAIKDRTDDGDDISDGGHRLAARDAALQPEDVNQRPFSSEAGEVDPDQLLGSTGNLKHVLRTALPPGIQPSDVTDPGTKARAAALAAARAEPSSEAGKAAQRQTQLKEARDQDNRDRDDSSPRAPRQD